MTLEGALFLIMGLAGYLVSVYSLFRLDTRSAKPGDWMWTVGMAIGIVAMILSVLLWTVPEFFSS